ncbi:MAG: hypothetical protein ACTHKR_02445 [Sphingomonas sp.]
MIFSMLQDGAVAPCQAAIVMVAHVGFLSVDRRLLTFDAIILMARDLPRALTLSNAELLIAMALIHGLRVRGSRREQNTQRHGAQLMLYLHRSSPFAEP